MRTWWGNISPPRERTRRLGATRDSLRADERDLELDELGGLDVDKVGD